MLKRVFSAALLVSGILMFAGPVEIKAADDATENRASSTAIGMGSATMPISCSPKVQDEFNLGINLLHNFWYPRALSTFDDIIAKDPECAMAYWGAAMTYNHPVWDAPTKTDEAAAWGYAQRGQKATEQNDRERLYLVAVAALFANGGAGTKDERDTAYVNAMSNVYARYPDDETKLFYGLAIYGNIKEGADSFAANDQAAALFMSVYDHDPNNPGALHYLIHVWDDPIHAKLALPMARAYAQSAADVPHALHMPSHIFTRLGLWPESALTNERGWNTSTIDTKADHKSGAYRDFHTLNYWQYADLMMGKYADAKHLTDIIAAQYAKLSEEKTAPDTPGLEARHVRGRTIYALPDRVAYGYFDMMARYVVETGAWSLADTIPLVAPSRDFAAMREQVLTIAALHTNHPDTAQKHADLVTAMYKMPEPNAYVSKILHIQSDEAQSAAAHAFHHDDQAIALASAAVAIENGITDAAQPPYPIFPPNEMLGKLLLSVNRPADAIKAFQAELVRTPGRPVAYSGIGEAAALLGRQDMATDNYRELLSIWSKADPSIERLVEAKSYLAAHQSLTER